ncbi:MAG: prepilin-type N-terminal cleavage/methylation domain-containing protein [Moraxella sp.]|nr:prepilin-type N-terminal cleavage/methylation domain-containing protein [Moraxella sp.]
MLYSNHSQHGFTLIELMIVMTIIGLLMAIAFPAYQKFTMDSANKSCLYEVKSYSNHVYTVFNDPETTQRLLPPFLSACIATTDASIWTTLNDEIVATPKLPGNARIVCNLSQGANCEIRQ